MAKLRSMIQQEDRANERHYVLLPWHVETEGACTQDVNFR